MLSQREPEGFSSNGIEPNSALLQTLKKIWHTDSFHKIQEILSSYLKSNFSSKFYLKSIILNDSKSSDDLFYSSIRNIEEEISTRSFFPSLVNPVYRIIRNSYKKMKLNHPNFNSDTTHKNSIHYFFLESNKGSCICYYWLADKTFFRNSDQNTFQGLEILVEAIFQKVKDLEQLSEIKKMAFRDELTGLGNARKLNLSIQDELNRSARYGGTFTVVFIDLDNFKDINDQYGHMVGDQVLKSFSNLLIKEVRNVDQVFRYGGDEFVLMLVESNLNSSLRALKRIKKSIDSYAYSDTDNGVEANITASFGVSNYPENGNDFKSLIKIADECMYKGKKSGKNKICHPGD